MLFSSQKYFLISLVISLLQSFFPLSFLVLAQVCGSTGSSNNCYHLLDDSHLMCVIFLILIGIVYLVK